MPVVFGTRDNGTDEIAEVVGRIPRVAVTIVGTMLHGSDCYILLWI